jgi:hypothetical protein
LDERVNITAKEIQATLNFALENPAQMSSFHALHYNVSNQIKKEKFNKKF